MSEWQPVIGLEIHAQLDTASKLFSGASTAYGAEPNTQASAVDVALPGTLPVPNRAVLEKAIRFGLAINATIAPKSIFARKNYFYPDLPKGYQISQYELPIVSDGILQVQARRRPHASTSSSSARIWKKTPANRCTRNSTPRPASI